jgi:hypothetical protein
LEEKSIGEKLKLKAKGGSLRSADFQSAWTVGANESPEKSRW